MIEKSKNKNQPEEDQTDSAGEGKGNVNIVKFLGSECAPGSFASEFILTSTIAAKYDEY